MEAVGMGLGNGMRGGKAWWVYSIWKRWEDGWVGIQMTTWETITKKKTNNKCVNKADEAKAALQLQLNFHLLCLEGNGSSSHLPAPPRQHRVRLHADCVSVCLPYGNFLKVNQTRHALQQAKGDRVVDRG